MKLTLRDLFWLVLVVGLALGWWLDRRQVFVTLAKDIHQLHNTNQDLAKQIRNLQRQVEGQGYKVEWNYETFDVSLCERDD